MRTLMRILSVCAIALGTLIAVTPSPTGAVVGTSAELTTFWSLILVVGGIAGIAISELEEKLDTENAAHTGSSTSTPSTYAREDLDEKMRRQYASLSPKYAEFLAKNEYVNNAAAKALFDRRIPERGRDIIALGKKSGLEYDAARGRLYDPTTGRTIASVHVHGGGRGNSIHTHRGILESIARWESDHRRQDRENGIRNRA